MSGSPTTRGISLTRFAEANATSRAVLIESNLSSTWCKGSKGGHDGASSTKDKSHGAARLLVTGQRHLAPFLNWQMRGCCPAVFSPKPTWHADIAIKYTLTVERAKPLSSSSCKTSLLQGWGSGKLSPLFWRTSLQMRATCHQKHSAPRRLWHSE